MLIILFRDTGSLVYETETEVFRQIFIKIKVYLILVTIHKIQIF